MTAGKATLGPKEPRAETQRATVQAAKAAGASTASAKRAAKVLKDGASATKRAMDDGNLSLNKVADITKLPKIEQAAVVEAVTDKKSPAHSTTTLACTLLSMGPHIRPQNFFYHPPRQSAERVLASRHAHAENRWQTVKGTVPTSNDP